MRRGLCALTMAVLSACAAGPDFTPPAAPSTAAYLEAGEPAPTVAAEGTAQRFDRNAPVPEQWWRNLGSAALDDTVEQALDGNYTLQSALASLRQSQDELRAGYGVFAPSLEADYNASRQRSLPARLGQGGPGPIFNLFTLSASVSYVLDLFGGQRRAVEALAARRDRQHSLARAAYLSLTANVVNASIARAAYAAEARALQRTVELRRGQVEVAAAQVAAGTAPESARLALRAQQAAAEAQLAQARQLEDQAAHLLVLLRGRAVGPASAAPELEELRIPGVLPLSLPSALVRQRPDILAAEAELHAAEADIGVATSAMLPSITLDASFGRGGGSPGAHMDFWSAGAGVAAPLFQGGRLWYQRRAAVDAYDKALADYHQTVLAAFTQVADVLRALAHDAEALQAQADASAAAEEALRLVQARYTAGTAGYLDLAQADATALQARLTLIQASAQRYQDTVALYAALGGGWGEAQDTTARAAIDRDQCHKDAYGRC